MKPDLAHATVLLFVPGDRPERFDKAAAAAPLAIIIDLEDAVASDRKAGARAAAGDYLKGQPRPVPALVRINPMGTRASLDDLTAIADGKLPADGLVLAKVEAARDVEIVRSYMPGRLPLLAMIETAAGLAAADAIAAALGPGDALGLGGADLAADLGCAFDWEPLLFARSRLVHAAAVARVAAIDVPYLDIADDEGLARETRLAIALGFTGKMAIHPRQVPLVMDALRPTAQEVAAARRVVGALERSGGAVARLDGRMIDAPVALAARRTLARAGEASTPRDLT